MVCVRCGNGDIHRIARSSIPDLLWGWLGSYPYYCRSCALVFRARYRVPDGPDRPHTPKAEYRLSRSTHSAAIVVRAQSGEQLTDVLLALSDAVNKHNPGVAPQITGKDIVTKETFSDVAHGP